MLQPNGSVILPISPLLSQLIYRYSLIQLGYFPVFSLINGETYPETGSLLTTSTTTPFRAKVSRGHFRRP